jgi:aryl-alcohol dehydrogenase-like predicted oxidoreductase
MMSRRRLLRGTVGLAAALPLARAISQTDERMTTRQIPSTKEALPVIGLGTYRVLDVAPDSAEYRELPAVLDALFAAGGRVIDSSPMYGRAEQTASELLAARNLRDKAFIATKVWTQGKDAGIAQMENSFRLLRTDRIDLMQIHNLVDWRTHLPTLRQWKERGRIRYIGITHYTSSAYEAVEAALKAEPFDFLQINYAIDDRDAENRLLPLARDKGVAVLCNRPFGGGGLLRRMKDKPLPGWAGEVGATSWAQLALKFVLANQAITCAIPGTGNPKNMLDDVRAGHGPILTTQQIGELITLAT